MVNSFSGLQYLGFFSASVEQKIFNGTCPICQGKAWRETECLYPLLYSISIQNPKLFRAAAVLKEFRGKRCYKVAFLSVFMLYWK
jgi:hypothetical protein